MYGGESGRRQLALLMEIPGYKIIDTLGEGGMATVYLAIQESFEREVALKVMSSNLLKDPSFGERFLREARIVSRLIHPNIVTVYDVGVHEGHHYLSMEYVPGQDLKECRYELNLLQALSVVKDVARALDYAGRKGYVHRDVKPENIMLHSEDMRAVLMDFGIARTTDMASGMTLTGTTMGTPHYMSPEQAKGARVDPRSDIYSLGVVLFELLAGFVPYDADSAVAVGIMHVSEAVPKLPSHLAIFQPVIDRALAKKSDERYQLASELIADLDALAEADIAEALRQQEALPEVQTVDASATTMVSSPALASVTKTGSQEAVSAREGFSVNMGDSIGGYDQSPTEVPRRGGSGFIALLILLALAAGAWYGWQSGWLEKIVATVTNEQPSSPVRPVVSAPAQEAVTYPLAADPQVLLQSDDIDSEKRQRVAEADQQQLQDEQPSYSLPDPDPALLELQEQIAAAQAEEVAQAAEVTRLLAVAQEHFAAGRLLTPKEGNALASYRALQTLQADSAEASAGIKRIEQALIEQIESLINHQQLDEAGLLLASARQHYPQSQPLLGLRLSLEQAQDAASRPKVGQLRVSAQSLSEIPAQQQPFIVPDRVIYLAFDYRNFSGNASVVQAVLYDSGRSIRIAQVPVIVDGMQGQRFFRIERPVEGFAKGRYHVDLLFEDEALDSVTFEVDSR